MMFAIPFVKPRKQYNLTNNIDSDEILKLTLIPNGNVKPEEPPLSEL